MMLLSGYGLFNVYSKISSSLFISREKTQLVDDFCLAVPEDWILVVDYLRQLGGKILRGCLSFQPNHNIYNYRQLRLEDT